MSLRALVTGVSGFIGSHLAIALQASGIRVRGVVRTNKLVPGVSEITSVDSIGPTTDWTAALAGIDIVFHIAGLSGLSNTAKTSDAYSIANAAGTRTLAEAAARAGARRFLFLSTIGVHGLSSRDKAFTEEDQPQPATPYAQSKLEGERHLIDIGSAAGMEWCVVRAPMVYGPHAPGNFSRLASLVAKGIPLPLAAAVAKKSFISVDNLVSILNHTAFHQSAANSLWLASDGDDVSTADFVRCIGAAMGKRAHLVFVPEGLLRSVANVVGRASDIDSLFNPLQIDNSRLRTRLNWAPRLNLSEGIQRAVRGD